MSCHQSAIIAIPFVGINGATAANGGMSGNVAAIGGNTPAIVDEVIAAIALAAFAARLGS